MPYRGKPSTACERCRARRLKCGRQLPSCSSCIRACIPCPGYRNQLDLHFRDESQDVVRRGESKSKRKPSERRAAEASLIEAEECRRGSMERISPHMLPTTLCYSVEDTTHGYLFSNYMDPGFQGNTGDLSYLLPLLDNGDSPISSTAITAAVDAVSLAALGNIRLSPPAMLKAQRQYAIALVNTNKALNHAQLCTTDQVLALVVLLSMYEVITCTDNSFMDRWATHLDGAVKLIELRGPEQLARPEGLGLFTQLRSQISLSRIYQQRRSPLILAQLTEQAAVYRDRDDQVMDQLATVIIQLTDFCADAKEAVSYNPIRLIEKALRLDADLKATLVDIPERWKYTNIHLPPLSQQQTTARGGIWGNSYHTYQSLAAAKLWNNYRCARIILQELTIDGIKLAKSYLSDEQSQQETWIEAQRALLAGQYHQTLGQLVDDVCASVPFYLGSQTIDKDIDHDEFSAEGTGSSGLALVWPLLIAANSGVASTDLRDWIAVCLDKIGHSMGINQALAMAKLLRQKMRTRQLG